jgi:ATP-dependent RNA helicase DDX18/HAS1
MPVSGLAIPEVDWIGLFDPPEVCKKYIHHVGRTARGINDLVHFVPGSIGFSFFPCSNPRFQLNEFNFSWSKISDVKSQLENLKTLFQSQPRKHTKSYK